MATVSHGTIEMLGDGPFGAVHAEWDPLLGRSVAVKELHPSFAGNAAFARAFLTRAERLFDLDHEHVLGIYRVGGRETPAVVRELAEGTLADAGPLPPPEVEAILRQALLGLQAMHQRGVVHGAIKPQNLFRRGERVKVGDFGVPGAPLVLKDPAQRYAAPAQRHGAPPSPGADLYALGLVACELLLGPSRFDELMQGDPRRISGLPPVLSLALQRLLESAEADRADAGEILARLDGASPTGTGALAPPVLDTSALDARLRPAKPKPVVDVQKVKRAGAITLAVLLVGFAVAGFLYLRGQRPDGRRVVLPTAPPAKPAAAPVTTPGTGVAAPQPTEPAPVAPQAAPAPAPSPQPVSPAPGPLPPVAASDAAKPRNTLPPASRGATPKAPVDESPAADEEAPAPRETAARGNARITQTLDARDLIRNLQPARYELGSLRAGQRAYVDQNGTYAAVPGDQGRFCIETANGDRSRGGTLSFELGREAKVFVGYDHSLRQKPGWLREFGATSEGWSVLLRNPGGAIVDEVRYDVFVRTFPAGTVTLGPNQERSLLGLFAKGNMYLVCVEPL